MDLTQQESEFLFNLKKHPVSNVSIQFPYQGESIEIDLQNDTGRIRFIADISNANLFVKKATFQLRYKKNITLRRIDFNGNHRNPPGSSPHPMFDGYENYVFQKEDHIHFYVEHYGERWALPLSCMPEIGITQNDDLYEKMEKFFKYCHVEALNVRKSLEF